MLMQRPPCARVLASATTACPAQGWQAPVVIWSWCEVGECSVASQTGSRCGALSPAGTGSADKCPWGGRGRHRGALPPPYSSGSRAGSSGSAFQGGKMTPDREAITPSRAQSCIHSTDVYEQPRMWGHSGKPGGLGRGMGAAATLPHARGPPPHSTLQTLPQAPCFPLGPAASAVLDPGCAPKPLGRGQCKPLHGAAGPLSTPAPAAPPPTGRPCGQQRPMAMKTPTIE